MDKVYKHPRPSPIAGQWYPGDSVRLAQAIDGYIEAAILPETSGEIVAVIAPHAGYRYSGPVAGHAFAALKGLQPDLIAVISPMHHPYAQPILTTAHDAYMTPLGSIGVDRQAIDALNETLKSTSGYEITAVERDSEHSLEIELPFLQRVIQTDFNIIPVMMRDQSVEVTKSLGEALAHVLRDRNRLLVASTDLSHFYTQEEANKFDHEMLRCIESFDPEAVLQAEKRGDGFACGRGAVAAVLWAARELGADTVRVVNYATSGDITGDMSSVVGYGAALVMASGGSP